MLASKIRMDETKIMQRYREYLQKRAENQQIQQQKEEEYKRIVQQRRAENQQKYQLATSKPRVDKTCCECGAKIPAHTKVFCRTRIGANPRTWNPRWINIYWCSQCRPLQKEENQ